MKNNSVFQPVWKLRGKSAAKRFELIRPWVTGRKVLDVGCVVGYTSPTWIHGLLRNVAKDVTGIDIDIKNMEQIRQREPGIQVFEGDARNFDLNDQFEVVHAGELIEHIDNFEGFFTAVKKHLKPDGFLILSTPNVECVNHVIYNLTGGLMVNDEHVVWFCDKTLSYLLRRNGFEVVKMEYFSTPTYGFRKLIRLIINLFPKRLSAQTIFVVARLSA